MKKYADLQCPEIGINTIKVDITKDGVEKEYWRAPQTRIYWLFRQYFRTVNPGGEVFTDAEYLNTGMPGLDAINTTLKALNSEFKNWDSRGGKGAARKPDVMGISYDGLKLELLEITTAAQERKERAGSTQLRQKLDVLNSSLFKQASKKNIVAAASRWEPNQNDPYQKFHIYQEKSLVFCFNPTYDPSVPDGLILYEIHPLDDEVEMDRVSAPPPPLVSIQRVFERLKDTTPVTRDEAFALMNSLKQQRWGNENLESYERAWLHNAFVFIHQRAINDNAIEIQDVSVLEVFKHFYGMMPDIPTYPTGPVPVPPRGSNQGKVTTPVMPRPGITYNPGQRMPMTGPRISPLKVK